MPATKQPNIIVLFSDQQRWDTLGCYGQPLASKHDLTPNLDAMAAEGVRFNLAFTPQPVCGPARAVLQSGKWATECNAHRNHNPVDHDQLVLGPLMQQAGYETAYIGKWHLASWGEHDGPDSYHFRAVPPERRRGYDYWLAADTLEAVSHSYDGHMWDGEGNRREFPPGRFRADVLGDWTIAYLRNRAAGKPDKPLFLMLSWIEPHHQNDHNCYEGPHGSKERFADAPVPGDLAGHDGDWPDNLADYLGCCWSLDQNVGRIRETLAELGMAEDTIIVYTSDHGSHFYTRPGEYKRTCHDAATHIPMVACGGPFTGGQAIDELVSLIDLPPTFLAAAGADVPAAMRGRPLQPLAADVPPAEWRSEVYIQISEALCGRAIRTPRWTYAVRAENVDGDTPADTQYREHYLYDNAAEPHQWNNLIADSAHDAIRAELRQRLLARIQAEEDSRPDILPAESDEQ